MDPNPHSFPVLSYVMSKLPFSRTLSSGPDIEQPSKRPPDPFPNPIESTMPQITDPKMLKHMTMAISHVAQARSVLQALGDRPDHETFDGARARIAEIETDLSKKLEEIVLSPRPPDVDWPQWRSHLSEKENEFRDAAMKESKIYESILELDEMHAAYEKMLRESEEELLMVYRKRVEEGDVAGEEEEEVDEIVNEEVVGILGRKDGLERVDLSGKRLKFVPEDFGRIKGLVSLNLSDNKLEVIADSICGLEKLEELNLSSNLLGALPDSIGLLHNLKILNVSGNKLHTLPDGICHCGSLVELDVSFNSLTYLPTNIGYELVNLRKLSIQLNKIRHLPTSVCEMRSLCFLDAHFNELRGLPHAIGRLTNLEILNLGSNFSDMTELPDTIGDLTNLEELDLSNNQIHALPDTFSRLQKLSKLNLDQNPIVIPPVEVVKEGVESVKMFMTKRRIEILEEEERKSQLEMKEEQQTGWLTRSTSWLNHVASGLSESVSGYLSPRAPRDPLLDQQL